MPASGKPTRAFLVDTNAFVAAIKHPRRETATLRFLITLLRTEDVALVGNEHWAEELLRYAEAFRSETATWLASALLDRARLVRVAPRYVKLSAKYVTTPDISTESETRGSSRSGVSRRPSGPFEPASARGRRGTIQTSFRPRRALRRSAFAFMPSRS